MISRVRDRYAARLRELTPHDVATRGWGRWRVMAQGLGVLTMLDLNDWLIARFAPGLPHRWDPNVFPWADDVAAAWPEIKREVQTYLTGREIPDTVAVNGFESGSEEALASVPTDVGIWRSLILQWFGEDIEENARHFPSIMRAVGGLGVTSFGLTALDPRAHLAAHEGPNRGAVRYQLPIVVPGPPGACRIRVGEEMIPWTEGHPVVFDLFVNHEVWNDTDEVRVLLMLEVPMPLPFPLSFSNGLAQRAYRYFPPFQGLPARVRELARDGDRSRRSMIRPAAGMARLLRDEAADQELTERGVTSLPLLTPSEIDELVAGYDALAPRDDDGLVVGYMRPDRSLSRAFVDLLMPVWDRHLPDLFLDARVCMTTFVAKHPGVDSVMFLHDDRTFVDERFHRAATVWVPLVDVGPDVLNGGLQIVPRSHLLPCGWAGSNTPDVIRPFEPELRRHLEPVRAAAGTGVIYDTRMLHASEPNRSERTRLAIVCAVAPRSAQIIHVIATGRRHRRIHAVDADFFLDHHPREIERNMPTDCPIIEELDEDISLRGEDLVVALGCSPVPTPFAALPEDLRRSDGRSMAALPVRVGPKPARNHDLAIRADEIRSAHSHRPLVDYTDLQGSWACAPLVRKFRHVGSSRAPLPADEVRTSRRSANVDLLVMEPRSRVALRVGPASRSRVELRVVECPSVGSGVLGHRAAIDLDIGMTIDLTSGDAVTVWNDGPGPLVALLCGTAGFRRGRSAARRGPVSDDPSRAA